jgi:mRNA interferase MazF
VIRRGELYRMDLCEPVGSRPAKRRPVLVIQGQSYLDSRLSTVTVLVITSNTGLAAQPGNVFLPAAATGLPKDSVANVTVLLTANKYELEEPPVGRVPADLMRRVDRGIRQALGV